MKGLVGFLFIPTETIAYEKGVERCCPVTVSGPDEFCLAACRLPAVSRCKAGAAKAKAALGAKK